MDLITLFGKLNFSMEYFPRYSRLCGTMKAFKLSIQMKLDKNPDENWVKEVNSLLRQAKDFLKEFKIDEAWRCFHTAQRVSVYGMNPHEIIDAVKELRNEVSKLNEWRRKSINDILGPPNNQGAGAIAPESLIKALQIKDEYYNNQYYKNKLTRKLYSLLFTLLSINVLAIFSFVGRWLYSNVITGSTSAS